MKFLYTIFFLLNTRPRINARPVYLKLNLYVTDSHQKLAGNKFKLNCQTTNQKSNKRLTIHLTLMMISAQIVETWLNVITILSPSQAYTHPDNHTLPTHDVTPGFKPFTEHYSSTILQHMCNVLSNPRIAHPGLAATIKNIWKEKPWDRRTFSAATIDGTRCRPSYWHLWNWYPTGSTKWVEYKLSLPNLVE